MPRQPSGLIRSRPGAARRHAGRFEIDHTIPLADRQRPDNVRQFHSTRPSSTIRWTTTPSQET
jgi:hypothetical protein